MDQSYFQPCIIGSSVNMMMIIIINLIYASIEGLYYDCRRGISSYQLAGAGVAPDLFVCLDIRRQTQYLTIIMY